MRKMRYCIWMLSLIGTMAQGAEMNPKTMIPNWDLLDPTQKQALQKELDSINWKELERQRAVIFEDEASWQNLSVFKEYAVSGSEENRELGKKLIGEGKVGCLIVAGGQGSRLGYTKAKGLFPVTIIKEKSLFQLFSEKILAAGKQVGHLLPVAIMTSSENHEEVVSSFKENDNFGLSENQLFFFSQKDLPLLDKNGNLFLETPTHLAVGPDGNASSLREFYSSGIWDMWHRQGVVYLNYMHIDNPLADPFDAELTGYHSRFKNSDIVVKCIRREDPEEKLGVMFEVDGKVGVVEYSEISSDEKQARNADGTLKNACGNIGLYSFSMDFVKDVALTYYDQFPFHKAWKAVKYLTPEGSSKKSEKPIAWKFEKFIFDVMPFAKDVKALLYPREECFAPLKNAEGNDSLSFVQIALQKRDRYVLEMISGKKASSEPLELDPAFYYPTKELLKKWKGKDISEEKGYITP